MLFQNWKLYSEYYAAIKRAPIIASEKRCVRKFYYRMLRWHRNDLFDDVVEAVKMSFQRLVQIN